MFIPRFSSTKMSNERGYYGVRCPVGSSGENNGHSFARFWLTVFYKPSVTSSPKPLGVDDFVVWSRFDFVGFADDSSEVDLCGDKFFTI
jgi:hypothetical protein